MILFVAFTKYDAFIEPWRWPLHLCNTVVFIMPICFIFKAKRLFYFTYFINVFGAMFAILMPNTGDMINMIDLISNKDCLHKHSKEKGEIYEKASFRSSFLRNTWGASACTGR